MEISTKEFSDGNDFNALNHHSSTDISGRVAIQSRLTFFSLPSEIRNSIMHFILVPGSILLRRPHDHYERASSAQFLATCRQAYEEGHAIFYGLNTFYMVPGSLKHTLRYFEILRPEHRALIQTLGIEFTLEDADVTWSEPAEEMYNNSFSELGLGGGDRRTRAAYHRSCHQCFSRNAVLMSTAIWRPKVAWLRDQQTSLVLQSFNQTITVNLEEAKEALQGIGAPDDHFLECWPSVRATMMDIIAVFCRNSRLLINARGWEGFKDWIEESRRSDPGWLKLGKISYHGGELARQMTPESLALCVR